MRVNVRIALFLSFLLLPLTGCGYGPWAKKVTAFANAAPPALNQATSAYQAANDAHTLEQEAVLVDHYAADGYHPGQIKPLLTKEELAARQQAITEITDYSSLVGALASGKHIPDLAAKTKSLTPSQNSSSSKSSSTTTNTLNIQELGLAFQGLDMAMKPVIEHKVRKHLQPSIEQADPYVQKICSLLEADMKTLRAQEKGDYRTLLIEQSQFLHKNNDELNPTEQRAEIIRLYTIEQDGQKADDDLSKAQQALEQLAAAHHRLVGKGK